MMFVRQLWLRFQALFRSRRSAQRLDSELQFHLDQQIAENIAAGMSPAEARRAARLTFGNPAALRETTRETWSWVWLETLLQDVRYASRTLRKSAGFSAVAILTLALGIGANTVVFSVVNGWLLRLPPVRDPNRLMVISSVNPAPDAYAADRSQVSALDYLDWRAQSTSFSGMAAADFDDFTISGGGSAPQWVAGARVSASFFDVLGVHPLLGRAIRPDEDQAGHEQVIVLSDQLWQERFGGDAHAIGRSVKVNGNPCTVIGVMPRGFQMPVRAQFWAPLVPLRDNLFGSRRDDRYLQVFARLKPGVSERHAGAEMQAIAQRLAQAHPNTSRGWGAKVWSLHQFQVADSGAQVATLFLSVAVGFVLLIACSNLASLLLARNAARRQELSIRSALGASRLRLARQLLTECLLLSVAGGALGILLAVWGVALLRSAINWNASAVAAAREITIDARVLVFTIVLCVASALLFGLLPAIRAARSDPGAALQESGRGATAGPARHRLQRFLVVGQLALSLFLLVGAGLFVDQFMEELRASIGFNAQDLLTATVWLRGLEYFSPQRQRQFSEDLQRRLAGLPEVGSVALSTDIPFDFPGDAHFTVDDRLAMKSSAEPSAGYFAVSPEYFATTQIPLLRGREFARSDTAGSAPVVIVNQTLANRFFARQDPIGRNIHLDGRKQSSEIVGVAGNVREFLGQADFSPEVFVPLEQNPSSLIRVVVRTRANDPTGFSDSLRRAVWAVDPNQAITEIRTMDRVIADSATGANIVAEMMAGFALLALLMAAVGVFGLLSYVVGRRTHEMGIRLALGSEPAQILRLVLRSGMTLVGIGTALGFVASLMLPKLITASFSGAFGMMHSTWVLAGGPVVLLMAGFAACCVPARRAMRVDPMVALRHE